MGKAPRREPTAQQSSQLVKITIAPDGRVLLHDLPLELMPVLAKLNPREPDFETRCAALRRIKEQ